MSAFGLMLAAVTVMPQGSVDFEAALLLTRANAFNFTAQQMPAVILSAEEVAAAKKVFRSESAEVAAANAALAPIVAAIAQGQELSSEQESAIRQARSRREAVELRWSEALKRATDRVIGTLTDDQKYVLSVPDYVRRNAAEQTASIRNAKSEEWPKLSERMVNRVIRHEADRIRTMQQKKGDIRKTDAQRNQEERALALEMNQLREAGLRYLEQVRNGNDATARELERQLAMNMMDVGAGEQRLRNLIAEILTPDPAVQALRLKAGL